MALRESVARVEPEQHFGEARFQRTESLAPGASADQRRTHPRFSVDLEVSIGSDHNFYAGFLENLSVGGVFIATHQLQKVGSVIEVNIQLPDRTEPIKARGEVRWIREYNERSNVPPGMGLRFLELPPGAKEAIDAFLSQRDPLFWDD